MHKKPVIYLSILSYRPITEEIETFWHPQNLGEIVGNLHYFGLGSAWFFFHTLRRRLLCGGVGHIQCLLMFRLLFPFQLVVITSRDLCWGNSMMLTMMAAAVE